MHRVGERVSIARTRVAGPIPETSSDHSRRATLTAAVIAAVMLTASTSIGALAQDASVPPDATPSPVAEASTASAAEASSAPDPAASAAPDALASPAPIETVDGDIASASEPRRLIVEAGDLWFAPNEITIRADEPTVLVLSGVGASAHNLMIDDLGLQLHVGPGIESEVLLSDLPPGTYSFYCSIFGHARGGMYGTLTVE